jgi:hypothetical protein
MKKNATQPKKNKLKVLIEILLFLICCVVFIYIRSGTFFYPWNDLSSYQQLKNLDNFEEVNITNNDTTLNGWMYYYNNSKTEKAPLIVYFAGNAENSSNTMADFLVQ